jgi:hypothetical protein
MARADGFKSYRVCGGYSFTTCAAVKISVVGNDVTVSVWNLSGNTAGSFGTQSPAGTIFTGIGFYNLPAGVDAVTGLGSMTVSGPARAGNNPGNWKLSNNGRVDFIVDVAQNSGAAGANGIASGCAASSQLPSTPPHLYMNPCSSNLGNPNDWVTFKFKISGGAWDPSQSDIVIRGINGTTGQQVECWTGTNPVSGAPATCTTVTPEPVSMTLLATGLAGMGGMGLLRRRKKNQNVA